MVSEDELFRRAVAGVRPLTKNNRAALRRARVGPSSSQQARRAAAQGDEVEGLTIAPVDPVHPFDPIAWQRDGLQQGVHRHFRLGHYPIDARLELVGLPAARAREELLRFIDDCMAMDVRMALIHHGRSQQPRAPANELRSYLARWLPHFDAVLAFHSAGTDHGGLAATYLLLRKSQKARLENLERHQKRRP